ncbi:hypothetical protein MSAN_00754200 [Mycena sanguinolenta]|uniref:Uncharacterized protein n=1 Tax=Mycena sanguinolenta TaxID=230812 RepID=A0A8H7DFI5_9AGAR|nr:hypothetical protein MSAN_00754200 [Mycena sanguinolenta]
MSDCFMESNRREFLRRIYGNTGVLLNGLSPHRPRSRHCPLIKNKAGVSNEDTIKAAAARLIERVRAMPLVQKNILKYELTVKVDRLPTTLAHDLGLKETEFTSMILIEADSHEKIRETLTSPEYKEIIKGALEHLTTLRTTTGSLARPSRSLTSRKWSCFDTKL